MQQPPGGAPGYWSPDRQWWWDGRQWVPAANAPNPPPAPWWPPPPSTPSFPAPSPGLRPFLIVALVVNSVIWGLFTIFGILGTVQNLTESATWSSTQWSEFYSTTVFFGIFDALFAIALVATIGVIRHAWWARYAAIIAGVASCLTCLGSVVGIPILIAAARAPGLSRRGAGTN
jgi:hypothetical protein